MKRHSRGPLNAGMRLCDPRRGLRRRAGFKLDCRRTGIPLPAALGRKAALLSLFYSSRFVAIPGRHRLGGGGPFAPTARPLKQPTHGSSPSPRVHRPLVFGVHRRDSSPPPPQDQPIVPEAQPGRRNAMAAGHIKAWQTVGRIRGRPIVVLHLPRRHRYVLTAAMTR